MATTFSAVGSPTSSVVAGRYAGALVVLLLALLGYLVFKQLTELVVRDAPDHVFVWCGLLALLAGALSRAKNADLPLFARRGLRACAVFLTLYAALEPFDIPYAAVPLDSPQVLFHSHARWVALGFAVLGWWRPAGAMASALLIWMMRDLQSGLTGFYFSNLDIRNVVEAITLVSLAAGLVGSMRHAPRVSQALALNQDAVARGLLLVFAAAIGGHLGNYFYSGVAKIMLDGGPLSWVLDNRLYDGIPGALEKGTLLTAAFPALTQAEYDLFKALSVPMNFVALIAQLLAVAAPLRRRWLIWITIAYDIFHLSVYLALGLLFWKWIALNTIILTTLLALKDEQWDKAARLTCLACALVGTAFFHTATLAWYDTPGFTSVYFEAALKNGKRVRIPNAYFLSSSYQVSQGRLWWPGGMEHFNHSIWGSVLHYDDALAGRTCTPPVRSMPAEPLYGPPAAVGEYVQAQHRKALQRIDARGRFNYYLVPHHHVPSPFVADPFYRVDKRDIATYFIVNDSVCLSLDHGRLKRRVIMRDETPVYDAVRDRVIGDEHATTPDA